MSKDEIGNLDPWWVKNVLWYPKDSDGQWVPMPDDEPPEKTLTHREAYLLHCWRLGIQEWRAEILWQELEANKRGHGKKGNSTS